ncbi:phage tail collar domain-containing protein [Rhodopirellula maiorica SM1]|uniref:Phage tail collar domain-containing protein n=1 Tax=Rhodopirellula maiorica SM1 TaxID=1265738 RepID=M5RNL3_9BACT|nr:tail fiber protein [Rhodopirellula maiorica]EMI20781.1 phage tail collar domain-containing protein [Rhodopirellula maiorica SM1]
MSEPFIAEIKIFAGNFAPRGYAFCDGQLLNISQNTALFSLIGTMYGGDGRSTMGLPNLKARVPVHVGNGPGLSSRSQGSTGGTPTVTLTEAQTPPHTHGLFGTNEDTDEEGETTAAGNLTGKPGGADGIYAPSGNNVQMADALSTVGTSGPHDNQMPVLVLNYIIALTGTYPSRS